jgi:hypothetical protein
MAEVKVRLLNGGPVSYVDLAAPGQQCSYCDCPITPDSPHWTPGYACDQPCPAEAVYVVTLASLDPPVCKRVPVCRRHCDEQLTDLAKLLGDRGMRIELLRGWIDPDGQETA